MNYKVIWNKSAIESLNEIIDYIIENQSINTGYNVYTNIKERTELLFVSPKQGRIVPEIKLYTDMYREVFYKYWRIIYRIENDLVKILLIIDARMDFEELLYEKLIKL